MAESPHHDHSQASDTRHGPGLLRRVHKRVALLVLVKVGIIALLLLALPAGLAVSLGAAHAAIVLAVVAFGAVLFVLRKRRGKPPTE